MRPCLFFVLVCALSCQEPTQVMLELSTDAACAREPLEPLMLVGTVIAAGTPDQVQRPTVTANTSTSACEGGEVGTIVLQPEDGAKSAGVLVVGRLHAQGGAPSEEQCLAFANPKPNAALVDGTSCIVARRQVEFIDHKPLRLPIRLSVACAGFVCGIDQTCVADELGPRCVSAVVGCNERGDCDAQGGGDLGGAGGQGGQGGQGGSGAGLVDATVTPLGDADGTPFTHVAGIDPPGKAHAVAVDQTGAGYLYAIEGDAPSFVTQLGANVPKTTSYRMRAASFNGVDVVAWDVSGRIVVYAAGGGTPYQMGGSLRDFVPTAPDSFLFLDDPSRQVMGQVGQQPAQPVCPAMPPGAVVAMAWGGGAIFSVGSVACQCGTCVELPGAAVAVDVAAHPTVPFAVAATSDGLSAFKNDAVLDSVTLLDAAAPDRLGRVHITPQGSVWVVATVAGPQGTFLARGTVSPTGVWGETWSRAYLPEVVGGAISLWATDTPTPAAYVVAADGQLARVDGL